MTEQNIRPITLTFRVVATVLFVLVWVKLATMFIFAGLAGTSWTLGDFAGTETYSGLLQPVNLIEAHRAPFNLGTALAAQGDLSGARSELSTALEKTNAADECVIRLNLTLVIEALGANATAASDSVGAATDLTEAQAVVAAAPIACRTGPLAEVNGRVGAEGSQAAAAAAAVAASAASSGDGTDGQGESTGPAPQDAASSTELSDVSSLMDRGQARQYSDGQSQGTPAENSVSKPW
ncbi:hypothetical protein [Cryobacterium zhongshanensis]|uniref:Tetratricopeptide repeat protein n=1 Tax=Cryobacterium zhongshanensis TaxID=2928153 RepID=A0AA41UGS2_9MICO|nr:hypothetical protein [Cryobacterium zhongshanensis]MCI4657624.1 hypothetical protein [Cryobacterium zhongshanensis]